MPPTTPVIPVTFSTIDPPTRQFVLPHTPVSVEVSIGVNWSRGQPLQWSSDTLSYASTASRSLTLAPIQPWADTIEESQRIERAIAELSSLAYSSGTQVQIGGENRPPRVLVDWKNFFSMVVVLVRIDVQRTQFFESGEPRQWKIQAEYVEWMTGRRTREMVIAANDGFGRAQGYDS